MGQQSVFCSLFVTLELLCIALYLECAASLPYKFVLDTSRRYHARCDVLQHQLSSLLCVRKTELELVCRKKSCCPWSLFTAFGSSYLYTGVEMGCGTHICNIGQPGYYVQARILKSVWHRDTVSASRVDSRYRSAKLPQADSSLNGYVHRRAGEQGLMPTRGPFTIQCFSPLQAYIYACYDITWKKPSLAHNTCILRLTCNTLVQKLLQNVAGILWMGCVAIHVCESGQLHSCVICLWLGQLSYARAIFFVQIPRGNLSVFSGSAALRSFCVDVRVFYLKRAAVGTECLGVCVYCVGSVQYLLVTWSDYSTSDQNIYTKWKHWQWTF